jgi:hypothetical protein
LKTKGIFRVLAAPIFALFNFIRDVPYSHDGARASYGSGRAAFTAVSAPRTRAMRRRHPL